LFTVVPDMVKLLALVAFHEICQASVFLSLDAGGDLTSFCKHQWHWS
jgi:hypothetical protein